MLARFFSGIYAALMLADQLGDRGTIVQDGPQHVVTVVDGWKLKSLTEEPVRSE
jgi:hypothetical protein